MDFLPTFEECEDAQVDFTATPLTRFIYENEPAGRDDEEKFRKELAELIEYIRAGGV